MHDMSPSVSTVPITVSLTPSLRRTAYNLAGSQLTEDQVFELAGALIHSLPNTPPTLPTQNVEKLDLLLKSLFLLMIKNRQVAELCSAMEKDFTVFDKEPQLQGIVEKILEMQK